MGIVAANAVTTLTVGGGFGGGAVGIGGGVDLGIIRNNVTTTVSGDVRARNLLDVLGVSNENVTSYSISAATYLLSPVSRGWIDQNGGEKQPARP